MVRDDPISEGENLGGDTRQSSNEMILEGLCRSLRSIPAVQVRGNQLIPDFLFFHKILMNQKIHYLGDEKLIVNLWLAKR